MSFVLSGSIVFQWHKCFLDGRDKQEDDEHTGRSSSSRTSKIIVKVCDFMAKNC